ncbi:MAG: hypothetical protein WBB01_12800 [Phormidesmis sp.]
MSIDGDLQAIASITEGDRALTLFTDRYSFIRLLAERINDPPTQEILFFHGAGGNGKSLLLKYLQQTVCKRLTAAQQRLADLQAALSQHQQAEQSYGESIAAYDAALHRAPDYVQALNNQGLALLNLGQLRAGQDQESEAAESLQAALMLFDRSLAITPNNTQICQLYDQLTQHLNALDS